MSSSVVHHRRSSDIMCICTISLCPFHLVHDLKTKPRKAFICFKLLVRVKIDLFASSGPKSIVFICILRKRGRGEHSMVRGDDLVVQMLYYKLYCVSLSRCLVFPLQLI